MKNHVDSTIMTPYQGTQFFDMIQLGELPGVKMIPEIDPGSLYYKGNHAGSGWPYLKTRLPKEQYEEAQAFRNSLRQNIDSLFLVHNIASKYMIPFIQRRIIVVSVARF